MAKDIDRSNKNKEGYKLCPCCKEYFNALIEVNPVVYGDELCNHCFGRLGFEYDWQATC